MREPLYLTAAELGLIAGLATTHSQRLAAELERRPELTAEGRARYAEQLDTVLGVLRAIKAATAEAA